ncbi:dienelactone hydrolase family protein [Limnohabitans sp.]|jgi:dienelactone hydrolase|uniref:dienelactone hydrolase family protein n=1 Tax=Limnohabitans sp. TaxID=1907725 RepID=UPI003919C856
MKQCLSTIFAGLVALVQVFALHTHAGEVRFTALKSNQLVTATLGKPADGSVGEKGSPAVVLLHHGGGCVDSQTGAYATALNAAGFFTLEPCLFRSVYQRERVAASYLPQVFGALRYLAQLPGVDKSRIAISGGSYGGTLTLMSATRWARENHADSSFPAFAAHVAFYPPCFLIERFVRSGRSIPQIPADAYSRYTGAPIRIFAGTLDDYEDRDPQSCASMVAAMGDEAKSLISMRLFDGATHGWDHGRTYSFFEAVACKGKGCENRNVSNPEVTQRGIEEMTSFLKASLKGQ